MRQWFEKITEKLLINIVWNILKVAGTAVLTGALVWINTNMATGTLHIILSFILCTVAIIAFFILRSLFGNQYPKFRWDAIHGKNRYVISFKSREVAEYTKTIEAIPLRDDVKSFPAGDYVWTGSESVPRIDPEDAFTLEMLESSDSGKKRYMVKPKNTVNKYEKNHYTIYIDLHDRDRNMQPRNYIYIKRPTKQITLELTIPSDLPVKNVRFKARTKFGEESTFRDEKAVAHSTGGKTIGSIQYMFRVARSKLFCVYEICWEWDKSSESE